MWCVVVAGGGGARYGGMKQFEELHGQRVIDWSVATAATESAGVVVVVPDAEVSRERERSQPHTVCAGGPTRSASVRAGLGAVPATAGVIVVHDAARPLASPELFRRVVAAVRAGADGAVPGVPVTDTIKEVDGTADGGTVGRTLDRSRLLAVQTPQAFDAGALRAAHSDESEATDDSALVEANGGTVVFVPGEVANIKITHAHDLQVALVHLQERAEAR